MRFPAFLILSIMALLAVAVAQAAAAQTPPRSEPDAGLQAPPALVVMDWTMLETLIALGYPPVAAADLEGYRTWVEAPRLPEDLVDIGMRNQPSLELLGQLQPDHFLVAPLFARLEPLLSRIAPVELIPLYTGQGDLWQALRDFTRSLARHTPEPAAADMLIQRVEERLQAVAQDLPDDVPPLLVVQFMDNRHVRVFGENSLYSAVLDRLQIGTAWQGSTNAWGFSLVGIEALADEGNLAPGPVRVVVVEPLPQGLKARMEEPGLWQSLPSVARGDVIYLPPSWSFGGLPSAQRFAELLHEAMTR